MSTSKQEQGFVHLLPVLAVAFLAFLLISSLIPITRHYNDGKSSVAGVYLAKGGDDNDSSKGSSGGGDSGSHDSGSSGGSSSSGSSGSSGSSSSGGGSSSGSSSSGSSSGSSNSVSSSAQSTPQSARIENKEIKVKDKEVVETKKENERVETKTTTERIKSEIREGNLRVKFEVENGQVKIETKVKKAENETELETEAENEAVKETEAELEKEGVKIATASNQIAVVNKRVGALTNFPLSVDPTSRQLTVSTPAGVKIVAVLPQKAVGNMLAAHVMDDIVSEKTNNNLASIPELVRLETKNDILGYQIKGTKTHRLLGLIPIKTEVESFVSAENGQVVETAQSLLGRILSRIAP